MFNNFSVCDLCEINASFGSRAAYKRDQAYCERIADVSLFESS